MKFYFTYVLLSEKDGRYYTGYSDNLDKRLIDHNTGRVTSTRNRRPLQLIYYESCLNQQDATRREKYLKSGNGKIYLRNRLKKYLRENPTG
ncbi:MAG: GIY-YIG nuclease family protein [Flavobacteriaceae bacterium]|nr:GIY-YIG nuclease family protein [Flavobacteriaceae bacterium]